MKEDTVVALRQPGSLSDDPLTDILWSGARQLLDQAIEAEVSAHIAAHPDLTDTEGRRRIVRGMSRSMLKRPWRALPVVDARRPWRAGQCPYSPHAWPDGREAPL